MGSIMGYHIGEGRFLTEENFSKELVLGENYTITATVSFIAQFRHWHQPSRAGVSTIFTWCLSVRPSYSLAQLPIN